MPYSNYPKVFDADYSPPQDVFTYREPFEKTYITDVYDISSVDALSSFFDTKSFFQQSPPSADMKPSNNLYKASTLDPSTLNPTLPPTGISAASDQPGYRESYFEAPFGQLDYSLGFSLDPAYINPAQPVPFSPLTQSSRASSRCGDAPEQVHSSLPSPRLIKRESSFCVASPEEQTTCKRPPRKRGRPRLDRLDTDGQATGSSSSKSQRRRRLPHNQVERKYREGLNSELERLRKAVPTLPHCDGEAAIAQPRPSKAMILSGAIQYIRSIERERNALREEVERLKRYHGHECLDVLV
ncbi:hypothetical protein BDU57DRAFT_241388 [Ampelomyces quisqualis]|uniref:BHLH domain-containing protein n=1 Tax=Ampelomyces quisqualis TaxID=50730 RepID=A0A6A5QQ85_AMPQU|nr:hypothetical protein BDU57DRAFT_241388 [Ampelomyces quisqualis]